MSSDKEISFEDEAYMTAIAEPKMVMDEVGADIDEHGHVAVTAETATQDPFTARGCLSNALDEAIEEVNDDAIDADGKNEDGGLVGYNGKDSKLQNPVKDFRDETSGEVEGTTDTPQNLLHPEDTQSPDEPKDGKEPTIQMDKAVTVKDSLSEALDSIAMDSKDPTPDYTNYSEENASDIRYKTPRVPESLGGDSDEPDENGLVYITCDFTVDPNKYVSINYKPKTQDIKNAAKAGKKPQAKAHVGSNNETTPEEESELSDLGSPNDEPTAKQEEQAAKEADNEEQVIKKDNTEKSKQEKETKDEAPEKVVLDYATFIDGSSFCCYDEIAGIDYTRITMDAGVKKPVTRETCETTFAQCRAQNPLFCRFHGPKLLEADIKQAFGARLGKLGRRCVVSVTKDKGAKEQFRFRLTVGCPPSLKGEVEDMIHLYMTQQPGISSPQEKMKDIGTDKAKLTQEFDMDLLRADKPPKTKDSLAQASIYRTQDYVKSNKVQPVVGDTPEDVERLANEGQEQPQEQEPEQAKPQAQEQEGTQEPEPTPEESQSEPVQEPEAQPTEQPTSQNEEVAETVSEPEQPQEQTETTSAAPTATQEPTEPQTTTAQTATQEQTAKPDTKNPAVLGKPSETKAKGNGTKQPKPKGTGGDKKGGNVGNLSGVKFSFAAYGEMPNEDPETRDTEPGGAGDIEGAELLSYASSEGVLKMPKGMLDYLKDLDLWKRAMKRGGKFNGQLAHDKNRPQMSNYGVEDPMADWIEGFMDGGTRTKNKRLVQLVFGKKYHEGGNDENLDDAPERIQRLFEEGGRRAVVEALLDAKGRYDEWVDKCNSASLAAKNKAGSGEDGNGDFEVSFDQLAAREADERDMADRAYDEAVAEVWDFGADSPTIQYFSPEQMSTLQKGDRIRFDHAEDDFEVLGYDKDTDTLTVAPYAPEDLVTDEDKEGWSERYQINPDGIRKLAKDEVVPSAGVGGDMDFDELLTQTEINENESEINESPNADRSGDEVRQNGGGETGGTEGQGNGESAEPEAQQAPDFSLELLTPEEDKRERARIKQRNEIKRRQDQRLEGGLGEMNQTLMDLDGAQGEDDLFNQTQRVEKPESAKPVFKKGDRVRLKNSDTVGTVVGGMGTYVDAGSLNGSSDYPDDVTVRWDSYSFDTPVKPENLEPFSSTTGNGESAESTEQKDGINGESEKPKGPTKDEISRAADAIAWSSCVRANPNFGENGTDDYEYADHLAEELKYDVDDAINGRSYEGFGVDGIPYQGTGQSRREVAKKLLQDLPEIDKHSAVRKALQSVVDAPTDYGYMPTEKDAINAAHKLSSVSGLSVSAMANDLYDRIVGDTPTTKADLDFITNTLGADNPVSKILAKKYENGGTTEAAQKAEQAADVALSGTPTQAQTEAANKVKESVATAKEQTRIADEITERIGTMKGEEGLGSALAKTAMESAVHGARDKAHKAEKSAGKAAEKLSKANEESYRDTERIAKGNAAAKVEKALTAMAQAVFPPESKSDSISDEADSIAAEVTAYAKENGCESCDTTELTDAVAQIKKSSDRFDTMMGVFRHSMDSVGVDFHAEDIGYLAEDIGNEARSLGGQMEGLRKTAKSIKERIDKAAELAAQRAELEKKVEGIVAHEEVKEKIAERTKAAEEGDFRRSYATEPVVFSRPLVGKTGAKLTGYVWPNKGLEYTDNRGEDRVKRISDWDYGEKNPETGRSIIHQFTVETADGDIKTVSAETAAKLLGVSTSEIKSEGLKRIRRAMAVQSMPEAQKKMISAWIKRMNNNSSFGSPLEADDEIALMKDGGLRVVGWRDERGYSRYPWKVMTISPDGALNEEHRRDKPKTKGFALSIEDFNDSVKGATASKESKKPSKTEAEKPTPTQEPTPEPKETPTQKEQTPSETNGATPDGMDSRIEGIYKDWVEEEIPDWVKSLSPEESKKYADMLEAARDWDSDEANTAFEELTKYEDAKSKEYEEGKSKPKVEAETKAEMPKAETSKSGKGGTSSDGSPEAQDKGGSNEPKGGTEETEDQRRQKVMDASKRLGIDAFKPMKELKRMLGVARQLSNRDKRMEQRAKDLETMIAHAERMKTQAPQEGGRWTGDEMPKEMRLKLTADALVRALIGTEG